MSPDPAIPFLAQALDPEHAQRIFSRRLGEVEVHAAHLRRHKPGRRCLIEYEIESPDGPGTLIGKIRAKGLDRASYETLAACWRAGVPVPEPVGLIPELQMWLQRKVPGTMATSLIAGPDGVELAGRIAEAAYTLHQAGVPARRRHTLGDELRILHDRLSALAGAEPRWTARLERILQACSRISAVLPQHPARGIHRDFYPDQVIVDGPQLYLVDLDLYCKGDTGLDIGNFIGHLTEQSLRMLGDPEVLSDREQALEERFIELGGEEERVAIQVYTTLTLVRHIHLSTRFPERSWLTEPLIDLCEQRLELTNRCSTVRSGLPASPSALLSR